MAPELGNILGWIEMLGEVDTTGVEPMTAVIPNTLRLRDDVVFLVRSLGGVAYARTRAAAGRVPGRVRGRDVAHRQDAYVLDIRLPEGYQPFRMERKRAAYEATGGGRPAMKPGSFQILVVSMTTR